MVAFDVLAASGDRGPFDPALFATYGWVLGIAMLGGAAQFYRKVKAGQARAFNLAELIGELVTSAIAGLITFWLCRWAGVNDWAMCAMSAIAGHMGSRALFLLEQVFERWLNRTFGNAAPAPAPSEAAKPQP
jgi:hypothetical protein